MAAIGYPRASISQFYVRRYFFNGKWPIRANIILSRHKHKTHLSQPKAGEQYRPRAFAADEPVPRFEINSSWATHRAEPCPWTIW